MRFILLILCTSMIFGSVLAADGAKKSKSGGSKQVKAGKSPAESNSVSSWRIKRLKIKIQRMFERTEKKYVKCMDNGTGDYRVDYERCKKWYEKYDKKIKRLVEIIQKVEPDYCPPGWYCSEEGSHSEVIEPT